MTVIKLNSRICLTLDTKNVLKKINIYYDDDDHDEDDDSDDDDDYYHYYYYYYYDNDYCLLKSL